MALITYKDVLYESKTDESVLDALLRHNVEVNHICTVGACQACVMVADKGDLPEKSTSGLKENQIEQGCFLSCQCIPTEALVVRNTDDFGSFSSATVIKKDFLADDICRLQLKVDLDYRAGQFINIKGPDNQIRSYSLASLPSEDNFIELHIKRVTDGIVSNYLLDDVALNDSIEIQGAVGDCFYPSNNTDKDILMISTGTGLAPLIGILRDAIANDHKGQIKLYHGDREPDGLYLHAELQNLASQHDNIHYIPCVSSPTTDIDDDIIRGRASDQAFADNKDLSDHLIYLCGSPNMVNDATKTAKSAGADKQDIYADPFSS